jgi:hypothetical protein
MSDAPIKRPAIPATTGVKDFESLRRFLEPVKTLIEIHEGVRGRKGIDRFVPEGELNGLFARVSAVETSIETGDTEAPDPPTNFSVTAQGWGNMLSWTNPNSADLYYIDIYCSTINNITTAKPVGVVTVIGRQGLADSFYHLPENLTLDHYYWIRSRDWTENYSEWVGDLGGGAGGWIAPGVATVGKVIDNIMEILKGGVGVYAAYDPLATYESGDRVTYNNKSYECYSIVDVTGIAPDANWDADPPLPPDDPTRGSAYWVRVGLVIEGDVDGINTVGIDGRLVVDGTLLARSIQTDSLSAISANLGQVEAGSIVVGGGGNYMWLNNGGDGRLCIGGDNPNTAPFRVDANGQLNIRGAITISPDGVSSPVACFRGAFNSGLAYYSGDVVTYAGGTWMYVNATGGAGHIPADDAYWDIYSPAGAVTFSRPLSQQPNAPEAKAGDLWYITDQFRTVRFNGVAWADTVGDITAQKTANDTAHVNGVPSADLITSISDLATATETLDHEVMTFKQAAAPTSGMAYGDIWLDDDGDGFPSYSNIYRYQDSWGGYTGTLAWRSCPDSGLGRAIIDLLNNVADTTMAQATADGKVKTFFDVIGAQAAIEATAQIGDLWYISGPESSSSYGDLMRYLGGSNWSRVADATQYNTAKDIIYMPQDPTDPASPAKGFFNDGARMGFYDRALSPIWKNYFDNTGKFYFTGNSTNYLQWDGSYFRLSTSQAGGIQINGGGGLTVNSAAGANGITINSGAGITVNSGGGITISGGGGFTVNDGGNIRLNAGGDINLYGHATNPSMINFYDPSSNLVAYIRSIGASQLQLRPVATNTKYLQIGDNSSKFLDVDIMATNEIWLVAGSSSREYIFNNLGVYTYDSNVASLGLASNLWKEVWATDGTINTSDATDKKDIVNSDLGLEFINQLAPKKWVWKDGGKRPHYGLISQDVGKVLAARGRDFAGFIRAENVKLKGKDGAEKWVPKADAGKDDTIIEEKEAFFIRYTEFIGPIIKAIQELDAKVNDMGGKLHAK